MFQHVNGVQLECLAPLCRVPRRLTSVWISPGDFNGKLSNQPIPVKRLRLCQWYFCQHSETRVAVWQDARIVARRCKNLLGKERTESFTHNLIGI